MAKQSINDKKTTKKSGESFVPFEKQHKLEKLKMYLIVVNSGQSNGILKYLYDLGVSSAFITSGHGTSMMQIGHGLAESKKQIVWALVPESKSDALKLKLKERFSISSLSEGMALSVSVSSVVGVSLYKFFSGMGMEDK